jgi:hypothetical protein
MRGGLDRESRRSARATSIRATYNELLRGDGGVGRIAAHPLLLGFHRSEGRDGLDRSVHLASGTMCGWLSSPCLVGGAHMQGTLGIAGAAEAHGQGVGDTRPHPAARRGADLHHRHPRDERRAAPRCRRRPARSTPHPLLSRTRRSSPCESSTDRPTASSDSTAANGSQVSTASTRSGRADFYIVSGRPFEAGCQPWAFAGEVLEIDLDIHDGFARVFETWWDIFRKGLERMQRLGRIDSSAGHLRSFATTPADTDAS